MYRKRVANSRFDEDHPKWLRVRGEDADVRGGKELREQGLRLRTREESARQPKRIRHRAVLDDVVWWPAADDNRRDVVVSLLVRRRSVEQRVEALPVRKLSAEDDGTRALLNYNI